jgi:cytochrome c oxidase subunit 2
MQNRREGRSKPSPSLIVAGILIVVFGIVVIVASLTVLQLPSAVTEQGKDTKNLYAVVLVISMVIYFGVTAGIIWACFRYRRRDNELPKQIHGSSVLEFTWTAIPVLILIGLFIPSFLLMRDLKTPPNDKEVEVEMEAIGHQWYWEFVYCQSGPDKCDDDAGNLHIQRTPPNYTNLVPPMFVVPVGQVVRIQVRSTDVIHSFSVPHFLYKIQAIPGNVNQLHFKVTKAGTYTGQCYQFCGTRHADMRFTVQAMDPADYQTWLSQQKKAQGLPTDTKVSATSAETP